MDRVVDWENFSALGGDDPLLGNTNMLHCWELEFRRRRGSAPLAFFYQNVPLRLRVALGLFVDDAGCTE